MSIAGSVGGDMKTGFARVSQELDANDTETVTSESVQVENGEGDRTIHQIDVIVKLSNEHDLVQGDVVQVAHDGSAYLGATDSKPGSGQYKDEVNYIGRTSGIFFYRMSYDSTNSLYTPASFVESGNTSFMGGSDDVTRRWPEGVTLTMAIQSIRAFADVSNASNIFLTYDFIIYYTD